MPAPPIGRKPLQDRRVLQSLAALCAIVLILLSIVGDKGLIRLHLLQDREASLKREIEALKVERAEWLEKIHSLRNNQTYLENLAREKMGLVRKDEKIILLRRSRQAE